MTALNAIGPTLAAVAISRNERRDIVGFIRNVRRVVDEIVIVDDGSSDGTLEYLRGCGVSITIVERRIESDGGFAAQRNAGIAVAKSDWLLHMDIDERITPELAREIRDVIADTAQNAFRYRRLNFFLHRPFEAGGWQNWNHPQLARNGKHQFCRPIHETVQVEGGDVKIGQLSATMWHLNDEDFLERIHKNANYAAATAREISAKSRVRWWTLILAPLSAFVKAYFLRGAWRHGERGLLFGLYAFSGTFNGYAVAWDQQNSIERNTLENLLDEAWDSNRSDAGKETNRD